MSLYTYRAVCDRVIDGDTVVLEIDLGFSMTAKVKVRLLGIDAPEAVGVSAEERARAKAAAEFLESLLFAIPQMRYEESLLVETKKTDGFGRYLAKITRERDELDVSAAMIEAGHARPYRAAV